MKDREGRAMRIKILTSPFARTSKCSSKSCVGSSRSRCRKRCLRRRSSEPGSIERRGSCFLLRSPKIPIAWERRNGSLFNLATATILSDGEIQFLVQEGEKTEAVFRSDDLVLRLRFASFERRCRCLARSGDA